MFLSLPTLFRVTYLSTKIVSEYIDQYSSMMITMSSNRSYKGHEGLLFVGDQNGL